MCFHGVKIEEFVAPPSLREINGLALSCCDKLKRVVLNDGLEKLGQYAFQNSAVESVRFPPLLSELPGGLFCRCRSLRKLELPEHLENIGNGCFYEAGLEEVHFPASVRNIYGDAFQYCSQLRAASFAEGSRLEWVGERVFGGIPLGAADVRFPSGARVSENAFEDPWAK